MILSLGRLLADPVVCEELLLGLGLLLVDQILICAFKHGFTSSSGSWCVKHFIADLSSSLRPPRRATKSWPSTSFWAWALRTSPGRCAAVCPRRSGSAGWAPPSKVFENGQGFRSRVLRA